MLYFFSTFNEDCKKAYDLLFDDVTGLKALQDETGYLTMSPDVASFQSGVLKITTDIRFPSTHALEEITAKLDEFGVEYTVDNYQAPLYNNPKSPLISTLMSVYNKATGANASPIAIGGGTYARALKCGCAFGPELPDMEATIHQANEYVTFEQLRFMSNVYYHAIKKIGEPKKIKLATLSTKYVLKSENVEVPTQDGEQIRLLTLKIGAKQD